MRKLILCLSILQIYIPCFAQTRSYTGLCAYSKSIDPFSWIVQPAVLGQNIPGGMSLLAEKLFMLPEVNYFEAAFTLPTYVGNFGIQMQTLTNPGHSQWRSGLAYGKQIGPDFSLGVSFDYAQSGNRRYGMEKKYFGGLGVSSRLSENLVAGFFARASAGSNTSGWTDLIVGMGYDVSPMVHFSLQINKEKDHLATVIAGIHYQLVKMIWARAGINTAVSGWWLGTGMLLKKFRIDFISNYHPQLGFSPAILFFFSITKSGK